MSKLLTNTPVLCDGFLADFINGRHIDAHIYKVALYEKDARLSSKTTSYTLAGEVSGAGYMAGGETLQGRSVVNGGLKWSDVTWKRAEFKAFWALIYNVSLGGRAVCVIGLGAERNVDGGSFTIALSDGPLIELVA